MINYDVVIDYMFRVSYRGGHPGIYVKQLCGFLNLMNLEPFNIISYSGEHTLTHPYDNLP